MVHRIWIGLLLVGFAGLGQGQDLNEALRKEVRDGDYDEAQLLLGNPAVDPDAADRDGYTALMYAARGNTPELVTLLAKAQANLDLQNNGGETALIIAVKRGRVDAARVMLMAGADTTLLDRRGRSALDWAQERKRTYLAQIILIASRPSGARIFITEKPVTLETELLIPPELVKDTPPLYTESAFKRGIEGRVILRIIIRKDGSIGAIRLHQRLENGLDRAAITAVRKWKFKPASVDGAPINVLADVEVDFMLQTKS
ncbi:MAG: TonB family protein [Acidobacteria bacterium]|nr:MAG: TonB family protein [Acidobacteriota bacterium]